MIRVKLVGIPKWNMEEMEELFDEAHAGKALEVKKMEGNFYCAVAMVDGIEVKMDNLIFHMRTSDIKLVHWEYGYTYDHIEFLTNSPSKYVHFLETGIDLDAE